MTDTFEELRDKILHRIDIIELVDLLNLSAEEIVDMFEGKVLDNSAEIKEYMNDD